MVAFINKLTGSTMYVADNRVDEYLAAGHTVANAADEETTPIEEEATPTEEETTPAEEEATPTEEETTPAEVPEEKKPRKKSTKEQ